MCMPGVECGATEDTEVGFNNTYHPSSGGVQQYTSPLCLHVTSFNYNVVGMVTTVWP